MGKLTQDEKDAIRDAGVAQWWKDWFEADYSWDGLADIPWQGWKVVISKTAYNKYIKTHSLPEGCPNKACQVVPADFEGLPEGTKTREATLQDYWRDQEDNLQGEEGGKQYTLAHLPAKYPDGTESWKANPDHENWKILSALITERLECGTKTNVKFFYRGEQVTGTDGRANFQGCVFPDLPPLTAKPGVAASPETPDSDKNALHLSLQQAAILHPQDFSGAIFGSPTNFYNAQFSRGNAYFRNSQFSGGNANFRNAQFSGGDADFSKAQFSGGDAKFWNAQFSGGDADFIEAQFSGGEANFDNAQFTGGNARFGHGHFSGGDASFENAAFSGGNFDFGDVRFDQCAIFENTTFPPAMSSDSAFHGTQFYGPANFLRTKFKDQHGNKLPDSDLHFPFNAFAHANIKDQLILTQRNEKDAQIEFSRALQSVKEACKGEDEDAQEDRWVALESGCTTLKRAMETISDKDRAQRYFKFSLLARQMRPKTRDTTKAFTWLYGKTSDYGDSIGWPIVWLFVTWGFFAVIYGLNAYFIEVKPSTLWSYFWGPGEFSATHIFRPLFIWSSSTPSADASWTGKYHAQLSGGGWVAIKILATIQSFLSLTLLFLFGLATKRKFQIS